MKRTVSYAKYTAKQFNAARVVNGPLGFWRWLEILAIIIAVLAAIIGAWSAWITQRGLEEDRQRWIEVEYPAMSAQRVQLAWTNLNEARGGQTGKRASFEYLYAQGYSFENYQAPCASNKSDNITETRLTHEHCNEPAILDGLTLPVRRDFPNSYEGRGNIWTSSSNPHVLEFDWPIYGVLDHKLIYKGNWYIRDDQSLYEGKWGANFRGSNLSGQSVKSANLPDCNFERANLKTANFSNLSGENCSFKNANLESANFSGADLSNASFVGANLTGVNFGGAQLDRANLVGAELVDTILTGASVNEANFTFANITGTIFCDIDWLSSYMVENHLDGASEIDKQFDPNFCVKGLTKEQIEAAYIFPPGGFDYRVNFPGAEFYQKLQVRAEKLKLKVKRFNVMLNILMFPAREEVIEEISDAKESEWLNPEFLTWGFYPIENSKMRSLSPVLCFDRNLYSCFKNNGDSVASYATKRDEIFIGMGFFPIGEDHSKQSLRTIYKRVQCSLAPPQFDLQAPPCHIAAFE